MIELDKHAVDRFPDQHAVFHFQNEHRRDGTEGKQGVGGAAALVGARPVEHDGPDASFEGNVRDPDHGAFPI